MVEGHHYCNVQTLTNNGFYDTIGRADETTKFSKENNEDNIDVTSILKPCDAYVENGGILCPKTSVNNETCYPNYFWCNDGAWIGKCNVERNDSIITISFNNQQVCGNPKFWAKVSDDTYGHGTIFVTSDAKKINPDFTHPVEKERVWSKSFGRTDPSLYHRGKRCTGPKQHVYFNWYGSIDKETPFNLPRNCRDNSDQIFPRNTSCQQFNEQYLEEYMNTFCQV